MIAKIAVPIILVLLICSAYLDWFYLHKKKKSWFWRLLWLLPIGAIAATVQQALERDYFPDDIEELVCYLDLLSLFTIPLFVVVLSDAIGRLFRRHKTGLIIGILLAFTTAFVYLWGKNIGFQQLEVTRTELTFKDIPSPFDGYRIVLFSDAHVGTYTGKRHHILEEAIDSINAQEADMVVFAGDLQNKKPSEVKPNVKLLGSIKAKDGVFAVLGNHDYAEYIDANYAEEYNNLKEIQFLQEKMGWQTLMNARRFLYRGQDSIAIAGMENDGEGRFPQLGDITHALWGISRNQFVIMIEHDPSAWRRKILPQSHVQLTLSGHTHGGQMSFFGWSPTSLVYRENAGLYTAGERKLYVSKGLGGVIPMRFCTPGEITVITLRKK